MGSLASSPARIHAVAPSQFSLEEVDALEWPFEVASSGARILVARLASATTPRLSSDIPLHGMVNISLDIATARARHAIATHMCRFVLISCECMYM